MCFKYKHNYVVLHVSVVLDCDIFIKREFSRVSWENPLRVFAKHRSLLYGYVKVLFTYYFFFHFSLFEIGFVLKSFEC